MSGIEGGIPVALAGAENIPGRSDCPRPDSAGQAFFEGGNALGRVRPGLAQMRVGVHLIVMVGVGARLLVGLNRGVGRT